MFKRRYRGWVKTDSGSTDSLLTVRQGADTALIILNE
jgi:hypothetical protein